MEIPAFVYVVWMCFRFAAFGSSCGKEKDKISIKKAG